MHDLIQKLDHFYSASSGDNREKIALEGCNIILAGLRQCKDAIDPQTGDSLSIPLLDLAKSIYDNVARKNEAVDRIGYMADFLQGTIYEIIGNPREKIIRTHQMLPLQKAKSFDQTSIRWLIRRPGKSIAEKCTLSRRVMAVKREFVPDTLENRLFKEFVHQFIPLLQRFLEEFRHGNALLDEKLLNSMKKWLRNEAMTIKPWRNLPPNNTLLGNKHYRKIWDAWRKLTIFPDTLASDIASVPCYRQQILFFCMIVQLQQFGVCFAEIPAKFNLRHGKFERGGDFKIAHSTVYGVYGNDLGEIISLSLANDIIIQTHSGTFKVSIADKSIIVNDQEFPCAGFDFIHFVDTILIPKIIVDAKHRTVPIAMQNTDAHDHISVDLNEGNPVFSFDKNKSEYSSLFIARQYWNFDNKIFSLSLKNAKVCLYLNQCETRVISDFWRHNDEEQMGDASRTAADFARDIYASFALKECNHTLLLPDMLDEMSDSARKLKDAFVVEDSERRGQWLPSSIAALFALLRKNEYILTEGLTFYFIERFGNTCSITSIIAKKPSFSQDLRAIIPESAGLIWERHPSVIIDKTSATQNSPIDYFMTITPISVINEKGKLAKPGSVNRREIVLSASDLRKSFPPPSEKCNFILLSNGIVLPPRYKPISLDRRELAHGAEILYQMELKCPQYHLWTDDLPKLSVIASENNKYTTRLLVSKDHDPVKTIRGQRTKLTTDEIKFILKGGKKEQYIDLQRGEGRSKDSYRVEVHLPLPPREDIQCKLNLYYTFGNANPYSLEFAPVDPIKAGFTLVKGEPRRFHDNLNAFAAPEFPPIREWGDSSDDSPSPISEIKFIEFWKRNLNDFRYFASFNSDEEILKEQKTISFIGQPVFVQPEKKDKTASYSSIKCGTDSFINRECYTNFSMYKELIGIKYKTQQFNPATGEFFDAVAGLHDSTSSPIPVKCNFLRNGQCGISFWKIRETGQEIKLYNPYPISEFSTEKIYNVYFSDNFVMNWIKVKILDASHVQILNDHEPFYKKNTIVLVPKHMLEQAFLSNIKHTYAIFSCKKLNDPIYVSVYQFPAICGAVVQREERDKLQWEKFIPANYDYARTEDDKNVLCDEKAFTRKDFRSRREISTWYALIGSQDEKGRFQAHVISRVPLTLDVLHEADFSKSILKWCLKNLTLNGRRPFTNSVPDNLKKTLLSTAPQIMELLERPHMPYRLKQMLIETLASYGDFQPEEFGAWLLKHFSDEKFSCVAIGNAIGDLKHPWQQQLWDLILKKWNNRNIVPDFIRRVTGIAISRYDEALHAIPFDTAKVILHDISSQLDLCCKEIKRLMESPQGNEESLDRKKQDCRNQLQFLLSMLRLRKDERTRNILHPSADITRQLQNDVQALMELNLSDLTIRVQGKETNLLNELYGFLTGAKRDEFMELETSDEGNA